MVCVRMVQCEQCVVQSGPLSAECVSKRSIVSGVCFRYGPLSVVCVSDMVHCQWFAFQIWSSQWRVFQNGSLLVVCDLEWSGVSGVCYVPEWSGVSGVCYVPEWSSQWCVFRNGPTSVVQVCKHFWCLAGVSEWDRRALLVRRGNHRQHLHLPHLLRAVQDQGARCKDLPSGKALAISTFHQRCLLHCSSYICFCAVERFTLVKALLK